MSITKVYLGDGVYAECAVEGIWLTIGGGAPNDVSFPKKIYLGPGTLANLEEYVQKLKSEAKP